MAPEPLSEAITALSQFLIADASLGDTLQRVADITHQAVPSAEFVAITMLDETGEPATTIFTDENAPEIDEAQYESGRGPCLDAWRHRKTVRLDDISLADAEYPEFSRAALDHGILSSLSLPLAAADRGIGALNLYASTRAGFSADDESLAGELATTAAVVLANSEAYWGAHQLSEDLRSAMQSRAVIEQARGILMGRSPGIDADAAFDQLVDAARRDGVRLRELAEKIVDRQPPGNGV